MQFSRADNSLEQLEFSEQMLMDVLANIFGVDIGKELI
jgi:hypothetical protein